MQSVSARSSSSLPLAWEAAANRPNKEIPPQQEIRAPSNMDVATSYAENAQKPLTKGKLPQACLQYLRAADSLYILSPEAQLYEMGVWEETSLFYQYFDQAIEVFQRMEEPDKSGLLPIFEKLTVRWMEGWKKENAPDYLHQPFFVKMANFHIKLPTSQLTISYALRMAAAFGGDQERTFLYFQQAVDTCLQISDEQMRMELFCEIVENAFAHYRTFPALNFNIAAFWVQLVELHREKICDFTAARCLSLAAHCYAELYYDQNEGLSCENVLSLKKIDALAVTHWLNAIVLFQSCLQNENLHKNEALIKTAIRNSWSQLIYHFLDAPKNPFLRQQFDINWFFNIVEPLSPSLRFSYFGILRLLNSATRRYREEVTKIAEILSRASQSLSQKEIFGLIGHLHKTKVIEPDDPQSLRMLIERLLSAKPSS